MTAITRFTISPQFPYPLPAADVLCCLLYVYRIDSPLNPGGIVPIGPSVKDLGLEESAGRGSQDRSGVFYRKECVTSPPHFGHDG